MELKNALTSDIENCCSNGIFTCSICMEDLDITEKCKTNCEHEYCEKCIHDWFKKEKISCPTCRQEIKYYINNSEKNNIIKIKERVSESNPLLVTEQENLINRINSKIYRLNMFICVNILYTLYNVILEGSNKAELWYYKEEYNNCSTNLKEIYNTLQEENEVYIYNDNIITKCLFPSVYVDECLS